MCKIKIRCCSKITVSRVILGDNSFELSVPEPRPRSGSKARDALDVSANMLTELDENKIFELKEVINITFSYAQVIHNNINSLNYFYYLCSIFCDIHEPQFQFNFASI